MSLLPRSGSCKNGIGYISLFAFMDAESDVPRAKRSHAAHGTILINQRAFPPVPPPGAALDLLGTPHEEVRPLT